jgi:hypothetical protein
LLPATGKELGVGDIAKVEPNIRTPPAKAMLEVTLGLLG